MARRFSSTPAAWVSRATLPLVKKPWKSPKRCTYSMMRLEYSEALEKICFKPSASLPITSSRKFWPQSRRASTT
jgi:hypothetical protein